MTIVREHLGCNCAVEDGGVLAGHCWIGQNRYGALALIQVVVLIMVLILQWSRRDRLESQSLCCMGLSL